MYPHTEVSRQTLNILQTTAPLLKEVNDLQKKPKSYFEYNSYSNTIRLMPQNYLVVWGRYEQCIEVVADPDAAINDDMAAKIFLTIRHHKFTRHHEIIIAELNKLLHEPEKKVYREWVTTRGWRF